MTCFSFSCCRLASERIYAVFTDYTHDKVKSTIFIQLSALVYVLVKFT